MTPDLPKRKSNDVPSETAAPPLASGPPVVALNGVGKTFANGVVALESLDLDVRPGELVSLLGPSGCGKSTALRIIAGLSEPSSGKIEWPQADVDALGDGRRQRALAAQACRTRAECCGASRRGARARRARKLCAELSARAFRRH